MIQKKVKIISASIIAIIILAIQIKSYAAKKSQKHDIFANKFSFEGCNFKLKLDNCKNNNLSSMTKTCLKYFPNQLKELFTSSIVTKSS